MWDVAAFSDSGLGGSACIFSVSVVVGLAEVTLIEIILITRSRSNPFNNSLIPSNQLL